MTTPATIDSNRTALIPHPANGDGLAGVARRLEGYLEDLATLFGFGDLDLDYSLEELEEDLTYGQD